ncbi:hypothetical protein CBR_g52298 [Chara braunii]|uniref:Uncharacterized protein n=1 Tax=Chara braunii TaxID=69332 RepID=A0A388MA08_CHABU|nr:hypothetical protein CBR_g52298 [Chara braunii]|eukprot:GBG91411.1 hypothetical protein CBR_g52298 [Chara braunii]
MHENEVGGFLDRFTVMVLELRELTASTQSFLRRIILKKVRARMTKYREQHRHVTEEPFEHLAVKRELGFLTGRFLICPADKASSTPAFVCKNFIRKLAFEMLSGHEFASIVPPLAAVISRIQCELSAMPVLSTAPATLPYLMTVFKAHKSTLHWITNTAKTVVSPEADLCACLLQFLLPLVQTFCKERSWEVEEWFGVNLRRTCGGAKGEELEPYHSNQGRTNDKLWPSWVDGDQAEGMGSMLFREEDVCWLTECCIANSVLRMGDDVWRQVRGFPMGLACSPISCDIYFFKYEYHAMMRLADTGNAHLIPYFSDTFKYIDDLGAINNTIIKSFMRKKEDREENDPCWIYPDEYIEIKENTEVAVDECGRKANFLSLTITITSPLQGRTSIPGTTSAKD